MRQYILLLVLTGLTLTSCRKDNSINTLEGKWRMIYVKDNTTNTTSTKPSNINGDVDITFTFSTSVAGIISGVTPTNSLYSDFTVGSDRTISIPDVTQTKIMETSWGLEFLDNIRYSQNYFFDNNSRLNIITNTNKTLTFIGQ